MLGRHAGRMDAEQTQLLPIEVTGPTAERAAAAPRVPAMTTGGAAAIHLAVAGPHFAQWWLFGGFFLVLAGVQVALALALWRSVDRRVLAGGAAVNLAAVLLWLVTRTAGLPLGPDAG